MFKSCFVTNVFQFLTYFYVLGEFPNYQDQISGRRIVLEDIEPLIQNLGPEFSVGKIGESFLGKKIQSVKFGTGKIKILIFVLGLPISKKIGQTFIVFEYMEHDLFGLKSMKIKFTPGQKKCLL